MKMPRSAELFEETDINCELKLLDKLYEEVSDDGIVSRFFCGVFLGKSDNVPKFNEKLADFKKLSLDEIQEEVAKNPEKFCHGFINDFNRVIIKLKNL